MEIQSQVKLEEDLDKTFLDEIKSMSKCNEIDMCIQCGTCSSSCPMAVYMDYTPRKIMSMIKNGFKEETLKSFTVWLCSSCYTCQVRCPAKIKITDVMYALKRKAIEEKVYPSRFSVPALTHEMYKLIAKYGRSSEIWLVINMYIRIRDLIGPLKMAPLGIDLIRTGRLSLKKEKIKNRKQLHDLLNAVKKGD